jgi:hypothetical protein
MIDGELCRMVLKDNSFWQIEDKQSVVVYLNKQNGMEWWSCAIKGDPEIDVKKIDVLNANELDDEKRTIVQQMMQPSKETLDPDQMKQVSKFTILINFPT